MKIQKLSRELQVIYQSILESEERSDAIADAVHPDYRSSAKNLYRYLVLRSFDLRKYHDSLSDLGLSALRSAEGYVYGNLHHVIKNLKLILQEPFEETSQVEIIGYKQSKKLLKKHARQLFNKTQKKPYTEIMVTLPDEAAEDKKIIEEMVLNGMEIARINLSHGDPVIWSKMVKIVRKVARKHKRELKIYMDLAGPKIRVADIEVVSKKGKKKNSIPIQKGEKILLTRRKTSGRKSKFDKNGKQTRKAEVGVLLPQIIEDAQVNDPIFFDDGMIKSVVIAKTAEDLELKITDCYKSKLGSGKGINLPNTKLNLPALTDQDLQNLPFVCQHADIVGYSFVRTQEDVDFLYEQLSVFQKENLGVVFKIENQEAFANLPQILFAGMKRNNIGVMIARGDLAVEIGFERISEVQNEILWLCEAAHVPVIWATQVLENLAKTGIPTRAEISDAAQGAKAECVMLNKGPHINEAIKALKNILVKMESHFFKKKDALRALAVAKNTLNVLNTKPAEKAK